jgi:hypothetical protein
MGIEMSWTSAEVEILKEYYSQGKAVEFIAHELKRTPAAIKLKASRLGLRRQRAGPDSATIQTLKRLSEKDIASRIASLLGEAPRLEVEAKVFSDDELMAFVDGIGGLTRFLKDLIGVELQNYQVEICEKLIGSRPLVCVTGRQVGKDFTIGCFSLWEAVTLANSRILIVSAAQRQSDLLNDRILAFIASNDQLYLSIEKAGREALRFKNGSAIYFLPATGLIRGYTEITRAFFNEARDIPELAYDAVTPMLSRRNGQLAVFSTPLGRTGKLWELWTSPLYEKAQVRSEQNKYLDRAFLDAERDRMSNGSYRCEYEGEFVASEANYFDLGAIQKCAEDYDLPLLPENGVRYSIGIDWGRKQDASVMIVVAAYPGAVKVAAIKSFEGVSFEEQLPAVRYLDDLYKPVSIVAEETGLGMGPCDRLEKMGVRITRFKTTNASKIEIYDYLRREFDKRLLTIPLSPIRLKRELELLEYETLPSGSVRIGHPGGEHDDFADALALALWGLRSGDTDRYAIGYVGGRGWDEDD